MITRLLVVATFLCLLVVTEAKADPLTFSNVVLLQNNNQTHVDLFSNQSSVFLGPQLNFLVDVSGSLPPGTTNTLVLTYTEMGSAPVTQSLDIPLFGSAQPPFTLLFSFTSNTASYQGVGANLTVDIIGSSPDFQIPGGQKVDSYTYSFNVAQPIPEPATLLLLGAGLAGIIPGTRKRRTRDVLVATNRGPVNANANKRE